MSTLNGQPTVSPSASNHYPTCITSSCRQLPTGASPDESLMLVVVSVDVQLKIITSFVKIGALKSILLLQGVNEILPFSRFFVRFG
jgi:hypothetical protein